VLRITADTNVIISALNFSGNPARILDMAEAGEIRLAISNDILNEVERVLQRPKFAWTQEQVDGAIRGLSAFAEHVEPKQRIDAIDVARRLAGSAMVSD
jgi:putative PIN family toxin of toxin-antitoxin system